MTHANLYTPKSQARKPEAPSTSGGGGGVARLWLTEKPSAALNLVGGLARAFGVHVTNQAESRKDGYWRLSNGDVVLPFQGHLLEMQFLGEKEREMRRSQYLTGGLPIFQRAFTAVPRIEMREGVGRGRPIRQYKIAKELITSAREIVNAGDIDREGQRIVDEMLEHCGVDPVGSDKKKVLRLALVSAREEDIAQQVLSLRESNGDPKWVRRGHAGLARQMCDAALGFNASMAYQAVTGQKHAAVGRVKTPVLGIVVDREREIAAFKARDYFVPRITLADGTEMEFHHRAGSEGQPGFDEAGRIIDEAVAKEICRIIGTGLPGRITKAQSRAGAEAPPLPFSATVLFSTVGKRTGMTPKQAEAAAQSLYEKHKAISYVGTDCRFLPTSMLQDARTTMSQLSRLYAGPAAGADLDLRSAAWNDQKVDEHFAIVPTGRLPTSATEHEKAVFDAVSKRYIAQFYPSFEFIKHQLSASFGADEFRASRRETVRVGWKEIEGSLEQGGPQAASESDVDDDGNDDRAKPGQRSGR